LTTYFDTRTNYIRHRLAGSLYYRGDLSDVEDICYGGIEGGEEGQAAVLSHVLRGVTGFSAKDIAVMDRD
jgi:hypothetical protein